MKLYLEFEPCNECRDIIKELAANPDIEESRKFLRHITYNHNEIVQAVVKEFPKQEKKQQFDWFK
jgi:cytidine deaminase